MKGNGGPDKDYIKERVDIVLLCKALGITLTPKGKEDWGLCPFHEDTVPSLSVNRNKGLFHCYGCQASGDVFDLVQKVRGCDFKEALTWLDNWLPAAAPVAVARAVEKPMIAIVDAQPLPDAAALLSPVLERYLQGFTRSKAALAYLESRGFKVAELMRLYPTIGYADGSLAAMVGAEQQSALTAAGIFTAKGGEHFHGCLVFPLEDSAGKLTAFYGRAVAGPPDKTHLRQKGRRGGIFNRRVSKTYDVVILTEAILDALSLLVMGFKNVQAILGTDGFTEEHLGILQQDRVKLVILALDNDGPGRNAAAAIKTRLLDAGLQVKVILPPGKDWNDALVAGVAPGTIRELIEQAPHHKPADGELLFDVRRDGLKQHFQINDITYTLLGVKEAFVANLKVNIRAARAGENFPPDNVDLYSGHSRSKCADNMAAFFELEPRAVEKDLIAILEYLESERDRKLDGAADPVKPLTEEERRIALEFLRNPNLLEVIVDDITRLGYVGEDSNKLLVFLAASSRKMVNPISVMVIAGSATGKSALMDAVAQLLPEEDVVATTSLSEQALQYMPPGGLENKFLMLSEAVHSETIDYQIREMLSAKRLSRMVVSKDPKTGELETRMVKRDVKVAAIMGSTNYKINPENSSRFFLISTDETPEQTRRIQEAQRQKHSPEGYIFRTCDAPRIIAKHRAAQKLLKNIVIFNPFAKYLDFPHQRLRTRRDNDRFVDLIACICYLRQYQKQPRTLHDNRLPESVEYYECDYTDYETAYQIMTQSIAASTYADLPKSLVTFFEDLRTLYRKTAADSKVKPTDVSLTQRDIRQAIPSLGNESIKQYLRELVGYEYLYLGRGKKRGMRNNYLLAADEPLTSFDFSRIPTPDQIRGLMATDSEAKVGKVG